MFPEKISSYTSAGDKAIKAKTTAKSLGGKKKGKKKQSITDEIDEILATDSLKLNGNEGGDGSREVDDNDNDNDNNNDKNIVGEPEKLRKEIRERPGISHQRDQNLLDPYVTGIAVRP